MNTQENLDTKESINTQESLDKWITEILNQLSKEKRTKILNDIFINYSWTDKSKTKFEIVKEKQIDMWKNIDAYLSWTINIDWEEITFKKWFFMFEEHYERRMTDSEFVIRILQDIDQTYKPTITIKIKSWILNMISSLLN